LRIRDAHGASNLIPRFFGGAKFEVKWGYCMRVFHPGAYLAGAGVNFLDATEDEVIDLARSMISELAIIICFLAIPPEQKKSLWANIASVDAQLGGNQSTN
jgi:hypothetical protein